LIDIDEIVLILGQLNSQASKKAGTTNLHIDVSDAVNVLVYVGIGAHNGDQTDEIQRTMDIYRHGLCSYSRFDVFLLILLQFRSRNGNSQF
jgi:hypothetical protein